ncbi:hypothetical protein RRG08_056013 [Elysia crispata]|uniref:Uncharacterized protein n=1 Tax=Elysia crispata TaxID=231223 RepID=A0AAE1DYE7_9GAST|nr:hypothetical protein RRG08_056013 [Elysia crispata]
MAPALTPLSSPLKLFDLLSSCLPASARVMDLENNSCCSLNLIPAEIVYPRLAGVRAQNQNVIDIGKQRRKTYIQKE